MDQAIREAPTERIKGRASGRSRGNTVSRRHVQFQDAVSSVVQCEAGLAKGPSSPDARPRLAAAQSRCKAAFLELVSLTDDPDDVVRAAAYYVRNTPTPSGNKARDMLRATEYRNYAGKCMKTHDRKITGTEGKTAKRKFTICHQHKLSELFSITDTRQAAVNLQVCVWQILDLARDDEKRSGQWRDTIQENEAEFASAPIRQAPPGTDRAASSDVMIGGDVRKAMPKEGEGDTSKLQGSGRCLGEQDSASPSPLGAEQPFNDGGGSTDTRPNSGRVRTDGGQSRRKGSKRRRDTTTRSSFSRHPSHTLRQSFSGPQQSSACATSSSTEPMLSPSSHDVRGRRGTAAPAVVVVATSSRASPSPHSNEPSRQDNRPDRTSSATMMPTTIGMSTPPFRPHHPPRSPQAKNRSSRGSEADESPAERDFSAQIDPERAVSRSGGPSAAVLRAGRRRSESRMVTNAERISTLFENLRDHERVQAKITVPRKLFERVTRRLESSKCLARSQAGWESNSVRIYSAPGVPETFVHAYMYDPVSTFGGSASNAIQYASQKFEASCEDGPSIVFRRVREWAVDGPKYSCDKRWEWLQSMETKRFFYESKTSSFVFRLVKMNEGKAAAKADASQKKYFVYVETNGSAKAKSDPVYGGLSLVEKVLDMLHGSNERKSLVIRERIGCQP